MRTHSKGPWKKFYEGSGDWLVIDGDGTEVAALSRPDAHFMGTGPGAAVNEANADLIAAAPDLLQALSELLAMCQRQEDFNDDGDGGMYERAQAAIDKATTR